MVDADGAMQKKDAMFLLVLAGAGAYAIHANWEAIHTRLGLGDIYPGRIKAVQLAKDAMTWANYGANWVVLRDRAEAGEIVVKGDPWHAEEIAKPRYLVTCTYLEGGEQRVHRFTVDVGTNAVVYEGLDAGKPAPR